MSFDPKTFSVEATLRDGGSVRVRAIRPDDKPLLLEHFASLGGDSIYFRFFGAKRKLSERELAGWSELDFVDRAGLAATLRSPEGERIIGVAHYVRTPGTRRAEVAFAVSDRHQGRGIGTVLLEHLARIARVRGITEFEADVLGGNRKMLGVFGQSGFAVARSVAEGVFHLVFPTAETEDFRRASTARDRLAAAQSVRPLVEPRSVVVAGGGALADAAERNLRAAGFAGTLVRVRDAAGGDWPAGGADLAVLDVPPGALEAVVSAAAGVGVRTLVVVSEGFGDDAEANRRLKEHVRAAGLRLLGPASLGVRNPDPAVALQASATPLAAEAGTVALLAQGGAVGVAILDHAAAAGIRLSSFVSAGDKADVSGNDLLSYWCEDPRTRVIALYLESFGNPRKFGRLAREIGEQKPIVVVKAGRTPASAEGGAAPPDEARFEGLFEQAGVVRSRTLQELFDVVSLLSTQPPPPGPRVGVVTNARGPATMFADACRGLRLALPAPEPETAARLVAALGAGARVENPLDLGIQAGADDYRRAIEVLAADGGVDSVVVVHVPVPGGPEPTAVAAALAAAFAWVPPEKPVLVAFVSSRPAPEEIHFGPRGRVPCYAFPENAALALAGANRHARWRARPRGEVRALDRFAQTAVRAVVERVTSQGGGWLADGDVASVLAATGLPSSEGSTVVEPALASLAVSIRVDASFGPLLVVSPRASEAEPEPPPVVRLTPVSDLDAEGVVDALPLPSLRASAASAPRAALVDCLLRLSAIVDVVPELAEVRLDPVQVLAAPAGVRIGRARIRV